MKNVFLYRESRDGTEQIVSEEFIVKKIGSETQARQQKLRTEIEAFEKHAGIPQWLSIVGHVLTIVGFALLIGAIDAFSDGEVPYETMVKNGLWWYFGFGMGTLIAGVSVGIAAFFRRRSAMASPVSRDLQERLKRLEAASRRELLVPETAIPVDILSEKLRSFLKRDLSSYTNSERYAFCDGPALCLSDICCVVKIPFERIERIEKVEGTIVFPNWNKEGDASAAALKRYKVRLQNGAYQVKPFYRIVIRGNEALAIVFPPYEYERLSPLLGSSAFTLVTVKK